MSRRPSWRVFRSWVRRTTASPTRHEPSDIVNIDEVSINHVIGNGDVNRDDMDRDDMTHDHHHDYGPSYEGTVMLDIGPGVGALVIVTGPELLGHEIEISAEAGVESAAGGEDAAGAGHAAWGGHAFRAAGAERAGAVEEENAVRVDGAGDARVMDGSRVVGGSRVAGGAPVGAARTHVAVRERRLGDHIMYCAVYPSLAEGGYTIWDGDRAVRQIRVIGGEVYQSVLSIAEFRSAASLSSVASES